MQEVLAGIGEKSEDTFICSYALDMIPIEFEYEDDGREQDVLCSSSIPVIHCRHEHVVSINPFAVVSLCTPSDKVIDQYINSSETIQEAAGLWRSNPRSSVDAETW